MHDRASEPSTTLEELRTLLEGQAAEMAQLKAALQATAHPKPRRRRPGAHLLMRPLHLVAVAAAVLVWMLSPAVTMASQAANTWAAAPSMPTARYGLASTAGPCPSNASSVCVYAIGGINTNGVLRTVETYNPATNTWLSSDTNSGPCTNSALACMPTARWGLAAVSAPCPSNTSSMCIYAAGGYNSSSGFVSAFDVYNPATNNWTACGNGNGGSGNPQPCLGNSAYPGMATAPCTFDGTKTCVYIVGGYAPLVFCSTTSACTGTTSSVREYDPAGNRFCGLTSCTSTGGTTYDLPAGRGGLAAGSAPCPGGTSPNCVYAIGGYDGKTATQTVEVLNPGNSGTPGNWTSSGDSANCYTRFNSSGPGCAQGNVVGSSSSIPATSCPHAILDCMPTARDDLAAAVAPCPNTSNTSCVYALGGENAFGGGAAGRQADGLNTVEAYNTASNVWVASNPTNSTTCSEGLPCMPTARYGLAAATAPCPGAASMSCVYALGGANLASGILATVEVYSPSASGPTAARIASFTAHRKANSVRFRWKVADRHGVAGFLIFAGYHQLTSRAVRPHPSRLYHYRAAWTGPGPFSLHVLLTY